MKYTTIESVQRYLRNRLKVNPFGVPSPINETELLNASTNDDLVLELIDYSEEFLDGYLALVYVLPLNNNPKHLILQKCVNALVVSELMSIHFSTNAFPENTDIGGFGTGNRNLAYQIIKSLCYGLNVNFIGLSNDSNDLTTNQAIILPNETLVRSRPNIVKEDLILVSSYTPIKSSDKRYVNFYPDDLDTYYKEVPYD